MISISFPCIHWTAPKAIPFRFYDLPSDDKELFIHRSSERKLSREHFGDDDDGHLGYGRKVDTKCLSLKCPFNKS